MLKILKFLKENLNFVFIDIVIVCYVSNVYVFEFLVKEYCFKSGLEILR